MGGMKCVSGSEDERSLQTIVDAGFQYIYEQGKEIGIFSIVLFSPIEKLCD